MTPVRELHDGDADQVVARVEEQLGHDASLNPLVNSELDRALLRDSFRHIADPAWVYDATGRIAGHLYGALLADSTRMSVWTGPDGASFDDAEVLSELVEEATAIWRVRGAKAHYVWCLGEPARIKHWTDLGYARVSVRGAMTLDRGHPRALPGGYSIRRGTFADLDRAIELDAVLDAAQGVEARSMTRVEREANREELMDTLDDPETHHYVVECNKRVIAQCVTFPAPPRRGSFDATLHLSEVVVDPRHQRRGVANAMLDTAFADGLAHGFRFAETQWRVSNLGATLFWTSYGFQPTYVRLQRTL